MEVTGREAQSCSMLIENVLEDRLESRKRSILSGAECMHRKNPRRSARVPREVTKRNGLRIGK